MRLKPAGLNANINAALTLLPDLNAVMAVTKGADMSLFVQNMLDISTGHLTEETRKRMGEDSRNFFVGKPCSLPFAVKGSSYGWFIDVRDADERAVSGAPYPADIIDCYELALRLGCSYILFDRDAERHASLNWYGDRNQLAYEEESLTQVGAETEEPPLTINHFKAMFDQR